ncbi:SDR family NAD(P)-dependent oxidoreductase [Rhizobium sp. LC145]|jgi:NAD(P)-dependent dehydrogenase (short-subunit alcohol dehydrogenase family)|uniref:SDR family NAD(P)-dependent oxidoreductase n=1 Tax=Rhizobium sp. LC145 TaxID=1120688 RepID=UPI00062A29F5|nr:SDR family NAD(P)-dependent oxidoreductase [Rhizobium sp. LC145]KKX27104.1 3-hydroxy-2-methylbutyryl-CoA dehydrogenase [Rhizobium sp. LC145]TKT56578.1 SDR family NAD(P)-dependent oxidoreductase [Rhizobiaceae bacterium LC148]
MRIEGSSALVTGGGSGLGEATARMLAARGAIVHVFDRNGEAAEKVARGIGGVALAGDVISEADAEEALDRAASAGDGLRILVNCAGVATAGRVLGREGPLPLADFEKVIRINLIGTFNMMRLAIARIAQASEREDKTRGVIVNTASIAAFEGQVGQAAYAAAKGGIVSLALPVAREVARFGIRVNTVAPGIFMTPLLHTLPQETQESLAAAVPYPARLGDPAEYADAVRFLIENQYANGEVIRLDGAMRMQPR